ncbi:MAG: hypothetical protein LQ347_005002 [Umbilicaria vellea]|nr:MAG: hypothetical protein LQ347_005002 [Umbilicaria vellea]
MSTKSLPFGAEFHMQRERRAFLSNERLRSQSSVQDWICDTFLNRCAEPKLRWKGRAATDIDVYEDLPASKRPRTRSPALDPAHIPLTQQALSQFDSRNRLMDSQSVPSVASDTSSGSINAYNIRFEPELNLRGVYFADDEPDKAPANLLMFHEAILKSRDSPEPDETDARNFRKRIRKAPNEAAIVRTVKPKIVPDEQLADDDTASMATEQLWQRANLLCPDRKPVLSTPKPDTTIGWASGIFPFPEATNLVRKAMYPLSKNLKLAWPLFTVEAKGDGGNLKVAKLQNLHNGALMLSNLLKLRRASGKEQDFFNKIHAMSLEFTSETVQLSCYWAIQDGNPSEVRYYGMSIGSWSVVDPNGKGYRDARRCTHNALDWVKDQGLVWIKSDMKLLEEGHRTEPPPQMTPPQS